MATIGRTSRRDRYAWQHICDSSTSFLSKLSRRGAAKPAHGTEPPRTLDAQSTASPLASRFMAPLCCSQAARIRPQSLLNLGRGLIWNPTVAPGSPPNADGCKPGRGARQGACDRPQCITIFKTTSPSAAAFATRRRDWIYMATMHAFSSTEMSHREK